MDAKFAFAKSLIKEAGQRVKSALADQLRITVKSDRRDLVTDLDQASQDFLVAAIQAAYPEDGFLAEEAGLRQTADKRSVWVIDPVDGTVNLIGQRTDFAIILAYLEDGVGQFGLIYDVMADNLYAGGGKFPVTLNDQPLPSLPKQDLSQSLVACNTGLYATNAFGLADLFNQSLGIRNYGCAGLSMARVLSGQLWGYASYLCPWDYWAAKIMGDSLGYELLSLDGTPLDGLSRQKVLFYPKADRDLVDQALVQEYL